MVLTQIIIDWIHLFVLTAAIGLLLHEAGLISLGHAGMLLGGAYAFGLGAMGSASFAAGGAAVLLLASLLALVVLRVGSDIFAVVTLAFGMILYRVSVAATNWTGGSLGLGPLPRPEWLDSDTGSMGTAALSGAVVVLVYWCVVRSNFGLELGASRDNELAARMQGISTGFVRYVAVVITGVMAACVGALQASSYGLVTPRMGVLEVSLQAVAAAMLAGVVWKQGRPLPTLAGYATASAALVVTPPLLRQILPGTVEEAVLRQALFGIVLYALVHPRVRGWMISRSEA